jgi:NAD-dependent epimerase/dehydratase family protein
VLKRSLAADGFGRSPAFCLVWSVLASRGPQGWSGESVSLIPAASSRNPLLIRPCRRTGARLTFCIRPIWLPDIIRLVRGGAYSPAAAERVAFFAAPGVEVVQVASPAAGEMAKLVSGARAERAALAAGVGARGSRRRGDGDRPAGRRRAGGRVAHEGRSPQRRGLASGRAVGERVTVTGGTGFTGGALAWALLDRGDQVWIVDSVSRGPRDPAFEALACRARVVEHDLARPLPCCTLPTELDAVYHLAARVGVEHATARSAPRCATISWPLQVPDLCVGPAGRARLLRLHQRGVRREFGARGGADGRGRTTSTGRAWGGARVIPHFVLRAPGARRPDRGVRVPTRGLRLSRGQPFAPGGDRRRPRPDRDQGAITLRERAAAAG